MSGFIDQVVTVNISATTATVSVPGTTIPAILAYHTHNTDKIRTYVDLAGMVTDGFSTTEPAYLMAQSILDQSPHPSTFKVIRGTTSVQQTITFLVTDNQAGDVVGFVLTDASGVTHAIQHTVASETTAQIATALAAISVSGATLSAGSSTVTVTITASGAIWYPSAITGGTLTDTTLTASPATDLSAAILVDNTWYGLSGAWLSSANIAAIAAWAESNNKVHFYTTADTANLAAASGVMHTLQGSSYKRSVGLFSGTPGDYGATGWMAAGLVPFPGSYNFAYKAIPGDLVDSLTPTQATNVTGNNGNFYIVMAGTNVAFDGRAASGQFIDLQIGIDGLSADIQSSVGTVLVTVPKLPYTRKGMAAIKAAVSGALQRAVDGGFLSNDAGFEYQVTIPDITQVAAADKTSRTLRSVNFTAYAQGAINKLVINGTVNV